jgi:hypothetical protein
MTEEYKANPKLQSSNAKFIGYDGEPESGTSKAGKPYRRCKLKFKLEGKDTEWKFTLFTPIQSEKTTFKSDEDLTLLSEYNIVWSEHDYPKDGKNYVIKTIRLIGDKK